MASLYVLEETSVMPGWNDSLLTATGLTNSYWKSWVPAAEAAIELGYARAIDESRLIFAVTRYDLPLPEGVDLDDEDAVDNFYQEQESLGFPAATVVAENPLAAQLRADEAKRGKQYWDYSDCRVDDVPAALPATHWMWSTGNVWVARANETLESWFEADLLAILSDTYTSWMMRPIEDLPTTGTLRYQTKDGDTVEVSADTDNVEAA